MEPVPDQIFKTIKINFINFEDEEISIISHAAKSVELEYETEMPPENAPKFNVRFYLKGTPKPFKEDVIKPTIEGENLIVKLGLPHMGCFITLAIDIKINQLNQHQ